MAQSDCLVPNKPGTLRVFVSSTFEDFEDERRLLASHVFPDIRQQCSGRHLEFVDVDLRCGITKEEAKGAGWIRRCLEQVEESEFCFIGLIGARYGTPAAEEIDEAILNWRKWIKDHTDKSGTELEILCGALRDDRKPRRAYFYFRDETYGQELREDEKQKYFSTDPQALEKLRDLKKRILQARSATLVVRTYSDPSQLSRLILSDLEREIAQRLPSASSKGITEEGETEQEAFVRSRTRLYLPRPFLSKLLDEHVTKSKVPLLVVGEPGIGKSALLANWYEGRRKSGKGLTLAHFLGSGYGSSSYTSIMTSILIAMKEHFHLDEPLPQSPPELQQAFPLWLATAAARAPEPIVLVLDGLDGLEGPQDWTMSWFPDVLPPKVRVIASATPDAPALEHLQKRGWLRHDLKGFIWSAEGEDQKKHNEKEALTELYLDHYGRSLDKEVRDAVLASPHTANPLFLLTVLEELRVVCSYRDMGNQVKDYLAAATLTELYGKVLHRWEEDYNVDDMDLVRKTVSALWAAHRGLSREELLDLLGGIQYVSDERYGPPIYIYRPYPAGELAPMFQAMQGQMTVRADLFRFSNEAFREAVRSRYLWEDSTRRRQHLELAIYFANKRRCLERSYAVGMPTDGYWPTRVTEELPWQLAAAEEWEGLKEFLQSALGLAMVAAETEALRTNDLIRYCNLLEKQGYDVVEGFKEAVVEFDDGEPADGNTAKLLTMLGKMLERFGRYDGARYFHEQFLNIVKKSWPDQPEPQVAALLGVGMNSVYRGDFSDAGLLLNEALHICERDLGQDHFLTAITLINLTLMLVERRDGTRAVSFGRKALEFATKVFPNPHTERATAMNNLALALMQTEEYAEAEVLLMEVLDIRERLFGKVSQFTAQSHNNLGLLYWYREEYEKAEKCYKTCLQILESITGRDNPDFANGLANLADLFRDKGSFKAAKPLYIEGIDILTRSLGPNHPDTLKAKNNYEAAAEGNRGSRPFEMVAVSQEVLAEANLLAGKRDYAEARISLYEKETGLPEQEDGPYGVVRIKTLRHLGDRAHRTGLYDLAEMIFRDLLVECRAFKGLHDSYTIEVLNNLGLTLRKKGKINEAESVYAEALEIARIFHGQNNLLVAQMCHNLGVLNDMKGEHVRAESYLRTALTIREKKLGPDHESTAVCRGNLAMTLFAQNAYAEAEHQLSKALENEDVSPYYRADLWAYQAILREKNGDTEEYRQALRQSFDLSAVGLPPEHPGLAPILVRMADLQTGEGNYEAAAELLLRALVTLANSLGSEDMRSDDVREKLSRLADRLDDECSIKAEVLKQLAQAEQHVGEDSSRRAQALANEAMWVASQGDDEGAVALIREALAIRERILGPKHLETALSLNNLGEMLHKMGQFDEAEVHIRRALDIRTEVLPSNHPDIATSRASLGKILGWKGDLSGAEELFRAGLQCLQRWFGSDHPKTIVARSLLAQVLRDEHKYDEAQLLFREVLSLQQRSLPKDHPTVMTTLKRLAATLVCADDPDQAVEVLLTALDGLGNKFEQPQQSILELFRSFGDYYLSSENYSRAQRLWLAGLDAMERLVDSDNPTYLRSVKDIAAKLGNLALTLEKQGQFPSAEAIRWRISNSLETHAGPDHPDTASALYDLGNVLNIVGKYDQAEPVLRRALEIREQSPTTGDTETALTLHCLGDVLESMGRFDESEPLLRRSLALREGHFGPNHPGTAFSVSFLGVLLRKMGKTKEAAALFRRALAIREVALGEEHPETAEALDNLGGLFVEMGDLEGAEPLLRRSLDVHLKVFGRKHSETAFCLNTMAALQARQREYTEAVELCSEALEIFEAKLGPTHPNTIQVRKNLHGYEQEKRVCEHLGVPQGPLSRLLDESDGSSDPNTAARMGEMGAKLFQAYQFDQAEMFYRRALEIREKAFGPNDPAIVRSLNNLATVLYYKRQFTKVEPLDRRALVVCEEVHGTEHYETLRSMNNLAHTLWKLGDYDAAEKLFERLLTGCKSALGTDHDKTLDVRMHLLCLRQWKEGIRMVWNPATPERW